MPLGKNIYLAAGGLLIYVGSPLGCLRSLIEHKAARYYFLPNINTLNDGRQYKYEVLGWYLYHILTLKTYGHHSEVLMNQ